MRLYGAALRKQGRRLAQLRTYFCKRSNLCLACELCNQYKWVQTEGIDPQTGQMVNLFNPRQQKWTEHFSWRAGGTKILGKTACGRATVEALHLNNLLAVKVRHNWVKAGWHPPTMP